MKKRRMKAKSKRNNPTKSLIKRQRQIDFYDEIYFSFFEIIHTAISRPHINNMNEVEILFEESIEYDSWNFHLDVTSFFLRQI